MKCTQFNLYTVCLSIVLKRDTHCDDLLHMLSLQFILTNEDKNDFCNLCTYQSILQIITHCLGNTELAIHHWSMKSLCTVAFGLSSTICYIRILHLSNLWDFFILYILALKYLGTHREWYHVPLDLHILVIPKMVKVKILHLLNYIT